MSAKVAHKTTRMCSTCFLWLGHERKVKRGMPSVIEFNDSERATCRDSGLTRASWHGPSCKKWQPWIG